jgi:hypothetical protein
VGDDFRWSAVDLLTVLDFGGSEGDCSTVVRVRSPIDEGRGRVVSFGASDLTDGVVVTRDGCCDDVLSDCNRVKTSEAKRVRD